MGPKETPKWGHFTFLRPSRVASASMTTSCRSRSVARFWLSSLRFMHSPKVAWLRTGAWCVPPVPVPPRPSNAARSSPLAIPVCGEIARVTRQCRTAAVEVEGTSTNGSLARRQSRGECTSSPSRYECGSDLGSERDADTPDNFDALTCLGSPTFLNTQVRSAPRQTLTSPQAGLGQRDRRSAFCRNRWSRLSKLSCRGAESNEGNS